MPENNVNDPTTDEEIAFARLVLSGKMTDRQAAEAVGLNPGTAAYIKSKPRVRAYMLERRAAVQQQLVEQDAEELRRFNHSRDRVLARLWQIADLAPEMTRNGMSAQVKALSMIIAIEGLIPSGSNRRAVSTPAKPTPDPVTPPFYVSEWMRTQQNGQSAGPQPSTTQDETTPISQSANGVPNNPPGSLDPAPTDLSSSRPVVEGPALPAPLNPSQTASSLPRVPMADYCAPDTRRPFSIDKNRFGRRR
jgi:hypothetical protein